MWILLALLHSFTSLGFFVFADFSKLKGLPLMFWLRVFGTIFLIPVIFILPPPTNPIFYLTVIGTSLIFCYTDVKFVGLSSEKGAGLSTRLETFTVWVVFILWTLINPDLLNKYLENPIKFLGIVFSIGACCFFSLRLKNCAISWDAVKKIFPAVCLGSVGFILGKIAVNTSPINIGVWYYVLFQAGLSFVLYSIFICFDSWKNPEKYEAKPIANKRAIFFGFIMSVSFLINMVVKYYAIWAVENPAYVSMIGMLSPFWVVILYKLIGRKENLDVISGLGIVLSCALLIFCTQIL